MLRSARLCLASLFLVTVACYHATIDTGLTPSTQTIEKPWASGWIYGLVAPSPVETMSKCANGVAKVETQLSFVNQLVNFLTLGIYTPMAIKVTCAQGGSSSISPGTSDILIGENATQQEQQDAFTRAAQESWRTGVPVLVRF